MSGCYPTNLDKDDDVSPLIRRIQELEKRLHELESNSISGSVLFTMRQTIETWQRGCEVKINTLMKCNQELEKRIEECEKLINRIYELKKVTSEDVQAFDRLNNARKWLEENGKTAEEILGDGKILLRGFPNPTMNGIYTTGKKENPSRQHLEECLHKKNVQIKQLEDELYRTRGEISAAQFKFHLAEIQNTKLSTQVDSLLDKVKHYQSTNTMNVNSVGASSAGGGGGGSPSYNFYCKKCGGSGFYYVDPGTGKYPCDGIKTKCTECNNDNKTSNR